MRVKKVLKKTLLILFVASIILCFGFLSMVGMLTIFPSLILGIAAFFLSGLVEGEVFKQNIKNAFKKLFNLKFAKDRLILLELDKLDKPKSDAGMTEDIIDLDNNAEWQEYKKCINKVDNLKSKKHDLASELQTQSNYKQLYQQRKKELQIAEAALLEKISNSKAPLIKQIVKNASRKRSLEYTLLFLSLLTSALFTLVTLHALHTAIAFLSVTISLALPASIPLIAIPLLAVSAGIGYCLLMYNNISSMIEENWLQKWKQQLTDIYRLKESENKIIYVFRVVVASLLILITLGLTAFATAATAGTWWPVAKWTVRHIKSLTKLTLNIITGAFVLLSQIGDFTYTLSNSLISMLKLIEKGSLKKLFVKLKAYMAEISKNENLLQLINPFRIIVALIELPFTALYFIAHLISVGLISDRFAKVPPKITAAINSSSEGLEDLHFFVPDDPKDPSSKNQAEQHHNNLFKVILIITLFPVKLASTFWDWSFSKTNQQPLTFSQAFRKAFGLKTSNPCLNLSDEDDKKLLTNIIEKEKERLEIKASEKTEKVSKKVELYNQVLSILSGSTEHTETEASSTITVAATHSTEAQIKAIKEIDYSVLNEHRSWWGIGQTRSAKTMEAIKTAIVENSPENKSIKPV